MASVTYINFVSHTLLCLTFPDGSSKIMQYSVISGAGHKSGFRTTWLTSSYFIDPCSQDLNLILPFPPQHAYTVFRSTSASSFRVLQFYFPTVYIYDRVQKNINIHTYKHINSWKDVFASRIYNSISPLQKKSGDD